MTEANAGPVPIRHFDVELVEEAPQVKKAPPPRAGWEQGRRVEEAVAAPAAAPENPKEQAYLDGFLHESDPEPPLTGDSLREEIILALRDIYDPEIPVNIYDLGLIYDIGIKDGHIDITMTLTTPNCPVAESMPGEVELRVLAVPGVATCDVDLVWDPAWNPAHMTDEAKLELGML